MFFSCRQQPNLSGLGMGFFLGGGELPVGVKGFCAHSGRTRRLISSLLLNTLWSHARKWGSDRLSEPGVAPHPVRTLLLFHLDRPSRGRRVSSQPALNSKLGSPISDTHQAFKAHSAHVLKLPPPKDPWEL
ncbi:Hypothetical predicted protein [Podarcis lilfordi]|uniref:Uncharacterized protein n=1 Tax=Podarcis lilfordi TaxID=74358 RepID=A0AA35KV64_9SAUR|nr:Hypothetical predicted protein [Podarcis lilfordi]